MAGGNGGRFWPFSRQAKPKQFMDIAESGKSFIRLTYDRFSRLIPAENILVVTLAGYRGLVKEQIPELPESNLLLEPYSRNTAPCLAYSNYTILRRNANATIVATPADHLIKDEDKFRTTMEKVLDFAENNPALVTLGIRPTSANINYGYIQVTGGRVLDQEDKPVKVKTFTEKPDKALAEVFCNSGEFYWNSGIFAWKASVIKEELERYTPEITSLFKGWEELNSLEDESAFLERVYTESPKISIDYAVMEKTDKAWLYPCDFGWADIDTWVALSNEAKDKDKDGNVVNTENKLLTGNKSSLLYTRNKKKLYAIKGLENFIVVDTDDALLICPKDEKKFNDLISSLGMPDYEDYR